MAEVLPMQRKTLSNQSKLKISAASKRRNRSRVNRSSELFRFPIAIRVRPFKSESLKRLL